MVRSSRAVQPHPNRYDVIEGSGAFSGQSQPIRDALHDATVLVLAMNEAQPDVAVHPQSYDEALGWYELATEPAPRP